MLQHKQTQTQRFLQRILPLLGSAVSVLQSSWCLHPNSTFWMAGSHMDLYTAQRWGGGRGRNANDPWMIALAALCELGWHKWEAMQKSPGCVLVQIIKLQVSFSLTKGQVGPEWVWWGCPQWKWDYFISVWYFGLFRIYCQDFSFTPERNEWNEKNGDEQQSQLKIWWVFYSHRTPQAVTFKKSIKFPHFTFKLWDLVQSSP